MGQVGAGEDVRQRILRFATREFAQAGYAATSIRDIARAAHVTTPMIYYYFGNKEGLYRAVIGAEFNELADLLSEASEKTRSFDDGLRRFTVTYLRFFLARGRVINVIFQEMFGQGEAYFVRVKETLVDLLRLAGEPPRADLQACASAILGIMNMFLLERMLAGRKVPVRQAIDQVLRVYVPGFLMPAGRSRTVTPSQGT